MSVVVSFAEITPPARFDDVPWTQVQIEESDTPSPGVWSVIDTLSLEPVDTDPADPRSRSFTTANGTGPDKWYRFTFFDASAGQSDPTDPIQKATAEAVYTTTDELVRILSIRNPTPEQLAAMQGLIDTAAGEINSEIDLRSGAALEEWQVELCASVNLDRAADLWRHTESVPGVLTVMDDALTPTPGRYSWERYAQRLAPLKDQWGIA